MKVKLTWCGGEKPVSQYPLGLGYLKSNIRGHRVEIVCPGDPLDDCDFVGLSTEAWGIAEAVKIAEKSKIPVIVGGQGVLWEKLKNYPFKHVVLGEGERAFQKILDGQISDQVVQEPFIKDVNTLKFPVRGRCGKDIPIFTSRGCPFFCKFCSSSVHWGKWRFHSAEYVVEEVAFLLKTYPQMQRLYTMDDLFVTNTSRFHKLYEFWIKRGWNKRFSIIAFFRSSLLTEELAKKMKTMNFSTVRFGAESASDRMLELLAKRATVTDHQRAIDICNRIGLDVGASWMYDLPGETPEEKQMTKDFIERNRGKCKILGWYKFKPFPGTAFYSGEDMLTCDMRVR